MLVPRESFEAREDVARLVIHRQDPRDCTYRIIHVSVDEKPEGSLNWNETLTVDVRPGLHTITVDNTWAKRTLTVACAPRASVHLTTGNVVTGFFLTLLLTIGVAPMKIFLEIRDDEAPVIRLPDSLTH